MHDTDRFPETVTERNERREAEIKEAMERETERRQTAIKNMHRLRALRLERDQSAVPNGPSPIKDPPQPIDDPPGPQPDEPPKPPPVNDPPPEEKPPSMRRGVNQPAAAG